MGLHGSVPLAGTVGRTTGLRYQSDFVSFLSGCFDESSFACPKASERDNIPISRRERIDVIPLVYRLHAGRIHPNRTKCTIVSPEYRSSRPQIPISTLFQASSSVVDALPLLAVGNRGVGGVDDHGEAVAPELDSKRQFFPSRRKGQKCLRCALWVADERDRAEHRAILGRRRFGVSVCWELRQNCHVASAPFSVEASGLDNSRLDVPFGRHFLS